MSSGNRWYQGEGSTRGDNGAEVSVLLIKGIQQVGSEARERWIPLQELVTHIGNAGPFDGIKFDFASAHSIRDRGEEQDRDFHTH